MAVQSASGSAFLLPTGAPLAFRNSVTEPVYGELTRAAAAGSIEPTSVQLVGLAAVGATLAATRSARRCDGKVTRNFFGSSGSSFTPPSFDPAQQAGVQEPIGFWDPLGLSADKDEATFKRRRAVEIKHGRIAMYATMGYITPEFFKFPGYLSPSLGLEFKDVPNGLAAISKVPLIGWCQIVFFIGLIEGTGFFTGVKSIGLMKDGSQSGTPGDYGVGFPTFIGKVADPAEKSKKLAAELANGRLAMMAIIGMFFQDGLTGSAWGEWALYTASPLRAVGGFAGRQAAQAGKVGRAARVARRAESIAATAIANGNFSILVAALKKAGLVETVSGNKPYTVFAPTDAAFKDLLQELGVTADQLLANPDLKSILLYHVVGGTAMSSGLKDGQKVATAQGGQLAVKIGGGKVQVGRASVTTADIACSNGVIHVIDKVLLPPPPPFDPAQEIGAMAPLGFFDPAGFSKAGDKAGFNNLRASEIKHGRVAMMAALGAVFQHYVKFPGFDTVPSGFGAITTPPGTYGFAALFLLSGVMELAVWTQDEKKEPGNFGDPVGLGMYNPDMRAKEINNGRIAMFSAIGIIAAEALTGKDGIAQLGF